MFNKASLSYLAVAFACSWGLVIGAWALGAERQPLLAFLAISFSMAGPAIGAVAGAFRFEPSGARAAVLGLRLRPNRWWLAAWAIGLALALASVAFTAWLSPHAYTDLRDAAIAITQASGQTLPPEALAGVPSTATLVLLAALVGAAINSVVLTFTEELGWRGYLHHLWRPFGFWRASLATGVVWGVWHAPAILLFGHNYPDDRLLGAVLFVGFCVLLSPLFTLVRDRGRSVFAAGILHGTINALGALTVLAVGGAAFPWNGIVGIGGIIALACGCLGVLAVRPGQAEPA